MASKKYSFLAGVLCLFASYGFAQTTTTTTSTVGSTAAYDVADSSVIPSRRMPQHTEFMNATYNYPAKPRNMWEVGLHTGILTIGGDVDSKLTFPSFGVSGVSVRKALGYLVSLRLDYLYGTAAGMNWRSSTGYVAGGNLNPWNNAGYAGAPVYYNFKTTMHDLALEAIFSLNNIRFHKSESKVNFYALIGIGGMIYEARNNVLNGTTPYSLYFCECKRH
jgi:hypothetical protein